MHRAMDEAISPAPSLSPMPGEAGRAFPGLGTWSGSTASIQGLARGLGKGLVEDQSWGPGILTFPTKPPRDSNPGKTRAFGSSTSNFSHHQLEDW